MRTYRFRHLMLSAVVAVAAFGVLVWATGFHARTAAEDKSADVLRPLSDVAADAIPVEYRPLAADPSFAGLSASEQENARVYERYNEAVVNITSVTLSYTWYMQPVPQSGTGSGSIIREDGLVLTNYHVTENAEQLTVTLADGGEYTAEVVGVDPENDLALIAFDPAGRILTTVPLGSSKDLVVGQKVLAIGNPFGLDRTLTTGIVSGLARPIQTSDGRIIDRMIQTDASINPGNSGGPLLDTQGRIIGVNTMIYSPSGGSVGIGFAVPVETAKRVIPDLLRYGEVQRGWIDIAPVEITPQLAQYADLPVDTGVLVSQVREGSLADEAGLVGGQRLVRAGSKSFYLGGDIIVEVDGARVLSLGHLLNALEDNKPGDAVEVIVLRGDERESLTVQLSERPS